ncbi:MBL fold metallo-hydrolase [Luteibaculum oceani]|uniref:MBL fold metallo-hydrolase n=1 Tax=Luteibaculum oceani TaxID=1294296 RepID=A0A5C6USE3_9FLAO|nr:MBL fold metallo-hydrolase [Luteibaculum oceani]TXC76252.1 MBL fold metallo-hydrolase [Luteibaculum oceani]
MKIEQIYTGCLAQGAYYIESEGEAIIIDPLREVKPYIERAEKDNAKIKYILETHFHADFVSGHISLAEKTGATIVYGPNANPSFKAHIAKDGEILNLGKLKIKVLHTPGHTMESTCYLLCDENGKEEAIFTGDTLFLGDVGRPDLAQKGADLTQEDLAGFLFESLRGKIMPLPDELTVYPAHGAGSACGKNMMKETVDTLGNQKKMNYALNPELSKEDFIKEVTDGLMPPPKYFPLNVKLNKEGYTDIDQILSQGTKALEPEDFEAVVNQKGALMLDVRAAADFVKGHVPNSIFIGLDGGFAPWVGELIVDIAQPILLIVDENRVEEAVTRLARVGFDNTLGYLKGGIEAWQSAGKAVETVESVPAKTLEEKFAEVKENVFDVRKCSEYGASHIEGAIHTSLAEINNHLDKYPKNAKAYIHCAGGYRSVIAASILKSRGIHNIVNVEGGFKDIKETSLPLTN